MVSLPNWKLVTVPHVVCCWAIVYDTNAHAITAKIIAHFIIKYRPRSNDLIDNDLKCRTDGHFYTIFWRISENIDCDL